MTTVLPLVRDIWRTEIVKHLNVVQVYVCACVCRELRDLLVPVRDDPHPVLPLDDGVWADFFTARQLQDMRSKSLLANLLWQCGGTYPAFVHSLFDRDYAPALFDWLGAGMLRFCHEGCDCQFAASAIATGNPHALTVAVECFDRPLPDSALALAVQTNDAMYSLIRALWFGHGEEKFRYSTDYARRLRDVLDTCAVDVLERCLRLEMSRWPANTVRHFLFDMSSNGEVRVLHRANYDVIFQWLHDRGILQEMVFGNYQMKDCWGASTPMFKVFYGRVKVMSDTGVITEWHGPAFLNHLHDVTLRRGK
jgi:hypothetical protein